MGTARASTAFTPCPAGKTISGLMSSSARWPVRCTASHETRTSVSERATRQLVFEPLELLEKLAALTPRPRINLVLYHGVLAPHAGWRARVIASSAPPVETSVAASASADANDEPTTAPFSRHWAWADLMRRAFDIDVLACPSCGGRMRLIATVEDPDAIRAILATLALSDERADRAPPFVPSLNTSHTAASGA